MYRYFCTRIFNTKKNAICILYNCSHLMGMFYRTIRMVENGIKPVYVFDGKPPDMKSGEVSCGLIQSRFSTFNFFLA